MCGGFNANITKAVNSLSHRGPDDFGIEWLENVMLGHRRLSIIDLSEKGGQPMKSKSNRY